MKRCMAKVLHLFFTPCCMFPTDKHEEGMNHSAKPDLKAKEVIANYRVLNKKN